MASKKCMLCEHDFDARGNSRICKDCSSIECKNCGIRFKVTLKEIKSNREFCSIKCAQSNPDTKKKILDACIQSHGGIGFAGDQPKPEKDLSHPETRQKIKETMLKRYGVESTFQMPEVRKIARENKNKKSKERLESIRKDLELRYAQMTLEEKINMSEEDRYYASKLLDIPEEEKKLIKFHRQSQAALNRHANIDPEIRRRGIDKQRESIKKYWESMPPNKRADELSRRRSKRTNGGRNYRATSKVNQSWVKIINQETDRKCLVEQKSGIYVFDLLLDDVFIDINPTCSHNTDTIFQHLVGLCNVPGCTKHTPLSPDYHNNRVDELYKYHEKDWIFVYDWMPRINVVNAIKNKISLYNKNKVYTQKSQSEEIVKFFTENIISSNPNDYDITISHEDELFVSRNKTGSLASVLLINNNTGTIILSGEEDNDLVKFSSARSARDSLFYASDTNTGSHYWTGAYSNVETVFPEVMSDIKRGEIVGTLAKHPVKVSLSRVEIFKIK